MEDFIHECKCACFGSITVFKRITTVDHRPDVATVAGNQMFKSFLGLGTISTDTRNSLESTDLYPASKCKYAKSSSPLPDVVLSCSSIPIVRRKISPRECGNHLRLLADSFSCRRSTHKDIVSGKPSPKVPKKFLSNFLNVLYRTSQKVWNFFSR